MGILRLIEAAVFLFGAALLITQVIIPLFKGTALFPILRKERRELEKEFTEVATEIEDQELRSDLEEFKRALNTQEIKDEQTK